MDKQNKKESAIMLEHERLVLCITLSKKGKKRIAELFEQGKSEAEVRKIMYSEIDKYVEQVVAPGN